MPKHVTVKTAGANLEIVRRWFNPGYFFLLFFCILWNGFMVFWHVMAISQGAWLMSFFGLIHTAVGVGLAYTVLAGFLNSTVISVGHGVSIKHRPLPWKGEKSIPRDQVDQVYCIEKIHRGKNGTTTTYQVVVRDAAGKKQTLLKRLMDADQALFVEQQIERFLGIKDTYVQGELPR